MNLQPFTNAEWLTVVNLARAAREARLKARVLKRAGLKTSAERLAANAQELESRIIKEACYDSRRESPSVSERAG